MMKYSHEIFIDVIQLHAYISTQQTCTHIPNKHVHTYPTHVHTNTHVGVYTHITSHIYTYIYSIY